MKTAFNNILYQDSPRLLDEDIFPGMLWWERIKGGTPKEDSDDYLYKNEFADRFNAPKDPEQRHGQPKGLRPDTGPVDEFRSKDLINSTNNDDDEQLIDEIMKTLEVK